MTKKHHPSWQRRSYQVSACQHENPHFGFWFNSEFLGAIYNLWEGTAQLASYTSGQSLHTTIICIYVDINVNQEVGPAHFAPGFPHGVHMPKPLLNARHDKLYRGWRHRRPCTCLVCTIWEVQRSTGLGATSPFKFSYPGTSWFSTLAIKQSMHNVYNNEKWWPYVYIICQLGWYTLNQTNMHQDWNCISANS